MPVSCFAAHKVAVIGSLCFADGWFLARLVWGGWNKLLTDGMVLLPATAALQGHNNTIRSRTALSAGIGVSPSRKPVTWWLEPFLGKVTILWDSGLSSRCSAQWASHRRQVSLCPAETCEAEEQRVMEPYPLHSTRSPFLCVCLVSLQKLCLFIFSLVDDFARSLHGCRRKMFACLSILHCSQLPHLFPFTHTYFCFLLCYSNRKKKSSS